MTSEPGYREQILREAVGDVDELRAVCLVGILFEHQIVLSKQVSRFVQQHAAEFVLEPLEPQAAAELVAGLFGFDADKLFAVFHRQWAELRDSTIFVELRGDLRLHEWVERLERLDV